MRKNTGKGRLVKMIGALMATAGLPVVAPVAVQQHGHGQHGGDMHGMHGGDEMQHCAGMIGGMSAATALQHRTDFSLSPSGNRGAMRHGGMAATTTVR